MKAVNTRVNNLTVTREGYNIRAKWVVPFEMVDKDNERCAEYIDSKMIFNQEGKKAADLVEAKDGVGNPNPKSKDISYTKADIFWIRGQGTGDEVVKNFDRKRFYPNSSRKCTNVNVGVWGGNKKGNGIKIWSMYKFGYPRKPKVEWSLEGNNATVKVTTDPGDDQCERYDTRIKIDYRKPGSSEYEPLFLDKDKARDGWFNRTETEYTATRDISGFTGNLTNGKAYILRCKAFARGMRGNNPQCEKDGVNPVISTLTIALPVAATIGTISVDKKNDPAGRIKVPISEVGKYTTKVQLQRRVGESGGWTDVSGAYDDDTCKALYDAYGAAEPDPGQYVYYRIKSINMIDALTVYSAPKRADCLYVAKPATQCFASMKILKVTQVRDTYSGSVQYGLKVVMAYTDSTYANTGCELSWSEYPNAWNSNVQPNVQLFPGNDSAATTDSYTKDYAHTKTAMLYGFEPGKTYYLRMRRYRTVDGTDYYSGYDTTLGTRLAVNIAGADAGDTCGVVSVTAQKTAGKVAVVIGVTEDSPNTGTEVSWSTDENAWQSNEQPSTLEATWDLANATGDAAENWSKQQTVYLIGLELGKTYYVRARRFLDSTAGRSYAPYSKAASFTTAATAVSASIQSSLLSVEPNGGDSAVAVVGWDGDHTGCEVSWSKDPNAWESSTRPQTFEFDWLDAGNKSGFPTEDTAVDQSKTYYTRTETDAGYIYAKVDSPVAADLGTYYELAWGHTSTCYISDLEEGETYYVRARSYYEGGGDRAWSEYSEPLVVVPYAAPNSVALDAPDSVAYGEPVELYWSVESEMEQVEWNLYEAGNVATALMTGTGSLCRASVPEERYRGRDSLEVFIEVSCGGGFTASDVATVRLVEVPTCHATVAPVLTAQPATFEVYADRADANVLATCRAKGVTMTMPDRDVEQLDGDVVWTDSVVASFEETTWGETAYRANLAQAVSDAEADVDAAQAAVEALDPDDPKRTIAQNALAAANARLAAAQAAKQADLDEHPDDDAVYVAEIDMPVTDLYDGAGYTLSVQTVETVAGLASETVDVDFTVDYAHKAPDPSADITVVTDIEARAARVNLAVDDGVAEETDVYDVYRKTQDGYDLIAANVPLDGDVYDTFAPFGNVELAYRVCMRTVDGSIAFRDFPYTMDVRGTRFDWDNRSVELPWNVETRDSYSKSFEARPHADGSVNGYYDKAVTRTGTLSTDTIKVKEQATLELVRALGNYPGACFCRTDKGDAFQCNADLSEVGISYNSGAVPVRFDLTKMDLSEEFMVREEEDVDNG